MTAQPKKKYKPDRPFPLHTLEEAISVPQAIQDKNAGKPIAPALLANALDISPSSSEFRVLTSSSFKYGLTEGTWNASAIGLFPLGNSLTKPVDPNKEIKDRQEAVLNVPVFKAVYEYYKNNKFPINDSYFKNMLEQTFGVPKEYVDDFINFLIENGKFANILTPTKGGLYVIFSDQPIVTTTDTSSESEIPPIEQEQKPKSTIPIEMPQQQLTKKANQIFIIHGKDTDAVEDLKKILLEFKVPFKVAIDEPHVGRPISKKVSELMHSCTSAIAILTADEQFTDPSGNSVSRPSDNAIYELGAASVLYEDKIVILKEDKVTLSSDFSDLGHISFKKGEVEAKSMQLIKELIGFGLLKFTPA